MEHLPIHLPREATLGGPVQYRWMYPFERFMFHLKKKVKNLSKVEGSIVAQSINEETSNFSAYYFAPSVQTKSRKPCRNDDGGEKPNYLTHVPDIFAQVGRLSGKRKKRWLTEEEQTHLHTYVLLNCEELLPYERMYVNQLRTHYPNYGEDEIGFMKQKEFAHWMRFYVHSCRTRGQTLDIWLEELVGGPLSLALSYPMYCTRGYAFKIFREGSSKKTVNSGISTQAGDIVYHGVLKEILEVEYPGVINLKCILFMCDWYDPSVGRGVRHDKFGVTTVNSSRKLNKYDPFILASQANQVCYIPYPRITRKRDPWVTVTQINPRGRVHGATNHRPLQQINIEYVGSVDQSLEDTGLVHLGEEATDDLINISEEELGEFEDEFDYASSEEYSSSDSD